MKPFIYGVHRVCKYTIKTRFYQDGKDGNMELFEVLRNMIITKDESIHDISSYKANYFKLMSAKSKALESVKWLSECLGDINTVVTTTLPFNLGKVKTVKLEYSVPDKLYEHVDKYIDEVMKLMLEIDPNMTDLDKVVFVYENIMTRTTYNSSREYSEYVPSIFTDGMGLCLAYAEAINMILSRLGIECSLAYSSPEQNHVWNYIKLDGEWYHADACWDDLQCGHFPEIYHVFLLRNTAEFTKGINKGNITKIHEFTNNANGKSTSTRFSNWWVHDIKGNMAYCQGYWYYLDKDKNAVIKRKIEGEDFTYAFKGASDKIERFWIEKGVLSVNVSSKIYRITLQ